MRSVPDWINNRHCSVGGGLSRSPVAVFSIVVAAFAARPAAAHVFWVQPDTFRPAVGASTAVRLVIGDDFPGEQRPRDAKKIERFELIGPGPDARSVAVQGSDGANPAGEIATARPGGYAVVFRGTESIITLEPEQFEEYLREDGLDDALRSRRERGESAAPGREAYSRCAKALLCAGGEGAKTGNAWSVPAGLAFEIMPASDPCAARTGDSFEFILLRDGRPLAGAKLTALYSADGRTHRASARTDAAGRASFTLARPGLWVINAVAMDRAEGKLRRPDVDWISVWTSLSFDVAPSAREPLPAHKP